MEEEYGEKVQFLVVYIHEAHALDGSAPAKKGPVVEEPLTPDERRAVAKTCGETLDMSPLKMLIDDMDDTTAAAYAAWPDRLYLVGKDGKIAYAGGEGPRGFLPDELEDAIRVELKLKALERP
jgi:hypothetical protein